MSIDFQERNIQTLVDIQKLQDIENNLITQLTTDKNLSSEQKKVIMFRVNEISMLRINLYKNLNKENTFYQDNLTSSSNTLSQQTNAIIIVEKQLNEA